MKYLLLALLICIYSACNENRQTNDEANTSSNNSTINNPEKEKEKIADSDGCYMKITGRDTAILMLEEKGNELSGKMLYDNFQKDGSRGIVKGIQEGEIIKLFYDFNSEGMRSVMEVYFKKVPGGLLRGMGDMDVKADTAYFVSGINYSDKEIFSKVDCQLIKNKYED